MPPAPDTVPAPGTAPTPDPLVAPRLRAIRRSPALLALRILGLELGLELLYLAYRWHIDLVGYRPSIAAELVAAGWWVFLCVSVLQVVLFLTLIARWGSESYTVLEGEVLHRSGILQRRVVRSPVRGFQSLAVQQGVLGRLLGYGTVRVFVPTLGQELVFTEIPHPQEFADLIAAAAEGGAAGAQFLIRRR